MEFVVDVANAMVIVDHSHHIFLIVVIVNKIYHSNKYGIHYLRTSKRLNDWDNGLLIVNLVHQCVIHIVVGFLILDIFLVTVHIEITINHINNIVNTDRNIVIRRFCFLDSFYYRQTR